MVKARLQVVLVLILVLFTLGVFAQGIPEVIFNSPTPNDNTHLFYGINNSPDINVYSIHDTGYEAYINENPSPIVGWWEANGDFTDDSVNEITGTNYGATFTSGIIGQAFDFDGASYVDLGESDLYKITNTISISAWVKTTAASNYPKAIVTNQWNHPTSGIYFGLTGGSTIHSAFSNGATFETLDATYTVNDGNWHHVVFTYSTDGENGFVKIYADGLLRNSATSSMSIISYSGETNTLIGKDSGVGGTEYWNGQIDDVQIYDRTLLASEVEHIYNMGTKPHMTFLDFNHTTITWLNFDQYYSGDTIFTDYFMNHNGEVVGDVERVTSKYNLSALLDGSGDYINIGDLNETSAGTISVWINPAVQIDSSNYNYGLFSNGLSSQSILLRWYEDDLSTGSLNAFLLNEGVGWREVSTTTTTWAKDNWYLVTLTWDGTNVNIYVNGELEGTNTSSAPLDINVDWVIGRSMYGAGEIDFNGMLESFLVFRRALGADEIKSLYDAQENQYTHTFQNLALGNYAYTAYAQGLDADVGDSGERTFEVVDALPDSDEDGYYDISDCNELQNIRNYLDINFELINNINCSETSEWNFSSEYDVEIYDGYFYDGESMQLGARNVFDVIIYVDGEEVNPEEYSIDYENGLIVVGYDSEGTITADYSYYSGFDPIGDGNDYFTGNFDGNNYSITGLTINTTNTDYVGLFGYATGTITNTKLVDIDITGNIRVGGLVGRLYNGTVSNSSVSGTIRGAEYVGGLVGGSYLGTISDSNTNVTVRGLERYMYWEEYEGYTYRNGDFVGGLVGGSSGTITNSHSTGLVSTNGFDNDEASIGGLVGVSTGTINSSSSSADVNGEWAVGGLVGSASGTILNSYATGKIYGESDYVGGLVGSLEADVNNSYATGIVEGGNYVGGLVGVSDGGGVYYSHATGNITGVYRVGGLVGGTNADVNYSFATGNVNGLEEYSEKVGGLIGSMIFNTVQFSYSLGIVNGGEGDLVGGLVGASYYSTITDSYSWSDVNGNENVGGLIGYSDNGASIHRCYSKGSVEGNEYVGGLVGGIIGGRVERSFAIGRVSSESNNAGGLIGYAFGSTILECYSNNDLVSGVNNVGGLVGKIVGYLITDSYSWSNVSAIGNNVGGLVGYLEQVEAGSVYKSYSTGTVDGNAYVGGLVGFIHVDDVLDSFTTSLITSTNSPYAAAIGNFSYRGANLDNVYWNNYLDYSDNVSCYSYNNEVEDIYSDENCVSVDENVSYFYDSLNGPMPEWDFDTVWLEIDNNYPIFQWAYDSDNDGKINSIDPLWYNSINVDSNGLTNDLNILVGGESTDNLFTGVKEIVFSDGNNIMMDFNFNFDNNVLDLSKIIVEKSTNGLVVDLNGQLQSDQNKALYLENNDFASLCVKNAPITSISEISSTCDGENEYDFTTCLSESYSTAGIDCTLTDGVIKVSNLRYSGILGVVEEEDTPSTGSSSSCTAQWSCTPWSNCLNGNQTRTCSKINNCSSVFGKPIETQSCTVGANIDNNIPTKPIDKNISDRKIIDNLDNNLADVDANPEKIDSQQNSFDYSLGLWIILIILVLIGIYFLVLKKK